MPYSRDALPREFVSRMRSELGDAFEAFIASYDRSPVRALRVNTLKLSVEEALRLLPWNTAPSELLEESRILLESAEHIGAHPYHMAGLFYMQEPSAACAVDVLDPKPDMRVLDLCAAPGGKSGAIAARMKGRGILIANEPVPSRASVLLRNLERLGVTNSMVTSAYPDAVARSWPGYFDAVLVDAPCSGEGMFRKNAQAIADWSPEHVHASALRQRGILEQASLTVREGGALVYSTCTFSREENEGVVEAFAKAHTEFELTFQRRLYPHECCGEGQFIARLVRTGGGSAPCPAALGLPKLEGGLWDEFSNEVFSRPPKGEAFSAGDRVLLISEDFPQAGRGIRVLGCGVAAGIRLRSRLEPEHALFMAATDALPRLSVELPIGSDELADYLAGEVTALPANMKGWCAVNVAGYPIGFGKAVDGVLKNKLPKGLRIRGLREARSDGEDE